MRKILATMSALTLMIGTIGCTVEKTEEGEMPEVDVRGGNLPKYDVDPADVEIRTEEKQVTVPDVDVDVNKKEATIPVPDVDVQPREN